MKHKGLLLLIVLIMSVAVLAAEAEGVSAADNDSTYWLKVNRKANVVTAYKLVKGEYVPYRAMICSTGAPGSETPLMTARISNRWRWGYLFGDVWGQYVTQIKGDYLFHSVYYEKKGCKDTLVTEEYNKLGTSCSKGCVRLTAMDAKWIYENCGNGTKVTVYSSDDPGPLGKPAALKVEADAEWDPTDPDSSNPDFRMPKPVITISENKEHSIEYGSDYDLREYVKAVDPSTYQDLTSQIEIYSVRRWDGDKWVKTSFSTKKIGKFNITYRVYSKYCGEAAYESFELNIDDSGAPVLNIPENRIVSPGDKNAVKGVEAHQKSRDRTGAVKVTIVSPDGKKQKLTYDEAVDYTFEAKGDYFMEVSIANYYSPHITSSRSIVIKCQDNLMRTMNKFVDYSVRVQ